VINQPIKLICEAYNYPKWAAKCHFLNFGGKELWLEVALG
jgi:hypothetical protein